MRKIKAKIHISVFFFYLIVANVLFAQNGLANYKKQRSNASSEQIKNDYMSLAIEELQRERYQLIFNQENVHYSKVDIMSTNDSGIVKAYTDALSGFSGEIFINRESNEVIHTKKFAGQKFFIRKNNLHWKLLGETLKIDEFLCYKAVATAIISNSKGSHEIEITAWYAPEISVPYGPDGYGGLPGLILQLEKNGTTTSISNLSFSDKSIDVDLLDVETTKIISEDSFNEIVASKFDSRKESKN